MILWYNNFNPLPRKEGDIDVPKKQALINFISIHSLVKRETLMVSKCPPSTAYFNPLPRKEGDRFNPANKNLLGDFNPLPRKEGDRKFFWAAITAARFQSTPS